MVFVTNTLSVTSVFAQDNIKLLGSWYTNNAMTVANNSWPAIDFGDIKYDGTMIHTLSYKIKATQASSGTVSVYGTAVASFGLYIPGQGFEGAYYKDTDGSVKPKFSAKGENVEPVNTWYTVETEWYEGFPNRYMKYTIKNDMGNILAQSDKIPGIWRDNWDAWDTEYAGSIMSTAVHVYNLSGAIVQIKDVAVTERKMKFEGYANVDFNNSGKKTGLSLLWFENVETEREGRKGVILNHDSEAKRYLYIDIDDNMLYDIPDDTPIEVTVDYFDEGEGFFELLYDAYGIPENIRNGIEGREECIRLTNTMEWKTHTFYVERMRLANRLGNFDVRIGVYSVVDGFSPEPVIVGSVTLKTVERQNPIRLESVGGNKAGNIYAKGEDIKVNLNIANKTERDARGDFTYTAKDEDGYTVYEGKVSGVFPANKTTPLVVLLQSEYDAQLMSLSLGAKQIEVYSAYGNQLDTITSENGVYGLGVSTEPIYLVGDFSDIKQADNSQAAIVPEYMENNVIPGECITLTMKKNTNEKIKFVTEKNDFIHIEKTEETPDGTLRVMLRTSKNMSEDIDVKLMAFNEAGEMIYRDTAVARICPEPIDISITSEQTAKGVDHWRARVEITNLSHENSVSGILTVTEPKDKAEYIKPRVISSLHPRESVTIYLNLPDAPTKTTYDLKLKLKLDNGYESDISKQLDFTVAKYADKKPIIDGKNDNGEWDGIWFGAYDAEHYGTDKGSGDKEWKGPEDASFSALSMWDEENLYMLVCVKDDAHYTKYDGDATYMWSADCIQFGIDDRVSGKETGGKYYTEIGVGDVPDLGAAVVRYSSYYGLPTWIVIENCQAAVKRSGGYTIYEYAIPWSELINEEFVPYANQKLKFAMLLNDSDTGSRGWLKYNGDMATNKDLNTFGIMTLEK